MSQPVNHQSPPPHPMSLNPSWSWALEWMSELCTLANELEPGRLISVDVCAQWHPAIDPPEVEGLHGPLLQGFVLNRHREHVHLVGPPPELQRRRPVDLVARLVGTLDHQAQTLLGAVIADAIVIEKWPVLADRLDELRSGGSNAGVHPPLPRSP